MLHFTHMRHQFLISKSHSRLAQARTVLISPVPAELADEADLRTFASFVPGGIDKVWMYRDSRALNNIFEKRQEACEKLESAGAAFLKSATLAWRYKDEQYRKIQSRKLKDAEHSNEERELTSFPVSREVLDELVALNLRPKHKTGFLGLLGQRVDTIDWFKVSFLSKYVMLESLTCQQAEISRLNKEINDNRQHVAKGKFLGSAFIRCNLQMGAHVLSQCLSYHEVCDRPASCFIRLIWFISA